MVLDSFSFDLLINRLIAAPLIFIKTRKSNKLSKKKEAETCGVWNDYMPVTVISSSFSSDRPAAVVWGSKVMIQFSPAIANGVTVIEPKSSTFLKGVFAFVCVFTLVCLGKSSQSESEFMNNHRKDSMWFSFGHFDTSKSYILGFKWLFSPAELSSLFSFLFCTACK